MLSILLNSHVPQHHWESSSIFLNLYTLHAFICFHLLDNLIFCCIVTWRRLAETKIGPKVRSWMENIQHGPLKLVSVFNFISLINKFNCIYYCLKIWTDTVELVYYSFDRGKNNFCWEHRVLIALLVFSSFLDYS